MNSEKKTDHTAKDAKAPTQNLAFGLFGRRVSAPTEPAPKGSPTPVVDKAA